MAFYSGTFTCGFCFFLNFGLLHVNKGFLGGSAGKESTCNVGDLGSISGLGRSPGEGGRATHSSILAWRIPWTVCSRWGHKESDTTERLSLLLHVNKRKPVGHLAQILA